MPLQRGPVLPYSVVAGVTAWGKRWVVASAKLTGSAFHPEAARLYDTFPEVLDEHPAFSAIVVNAPVGYGDVVGEGLRLCDLEARRLLGRRAMTIRRQPSRQTLLGSGDVARERLDAATKGRLEVMRQVAGEMSPYRQRLVYEGHPELSFYLLNGERPLASPKRLAVGRDERRAVLSAKINGIERILESSIAPTKHLLDASALLYSARRVFLHAAKRLPSEAQWDSEGLRMEIVY